MIPINSHGILGIIGRMDTIEGFPLLNWAHPSNLIILPTNNVTDVYAMPYPVRRLTGLIVLR